MSEQIDGAHELCGLEGLSKMHLESGSQRVLAMVLTRERGHGRGGNGRDTWYG